MTGTVLFGDDGSASADLAWMWINAQQWRGWTVDALTAVPDRDAGHGAMPWQPEHPRQPLPASGLASLRFWRSAADPRAALVEYPDKDLIVVGPRGKGLFKALHLGSTAEWLMHAPPAPLVIARRGMPVRTALVCTDGSAGALAGAQAFGTMPWLADVNVTVVAVHQVGLDAAAAAAETGALLEGRARSVMAKDVAPNETAVFYHVRDIILSLLQTTGADLVVVGSRGLSSWQAARAGSIASSLAAHAPCSVLMARAVQR
jgi:nucleotide-binding universal stress UspA family protein